MQSIKRKLSGLLIGSAILAIAFIMIFVNITIGNKFNQYMIDIQNKREERIVTYFEEVYKRDGEWNENSAIELMHEAYMSNYCLTLLDGERNIVWGMNPHDIKNKSHLDKMFSKDKGVYTSKEFELKTNGKVVGYVDIGQYSSVLLSEEDITFKRSINKSIIFSGTLTLIIIVGISLYFSKKISKPIKEVADTSVSLSKGDFKKKSNIISNIEELEDLKNSINILGEKLKTQDMLRKRLVSDISHEIRTPLNILQNNLEAMIDGIFPVTKERLDYLNDEVIRFGMLLDNLNVLKEFEDESIKLDFQQLSLNELITETYQEFYNIAQGKNIKLEYCVNDDENFYIIGDRYKLKQVLINLISNAIKFNKEDGFVIIRLYKNNKNIIIEVEDSGIGINKEDLDFVFERLYRGDKSRNEIEGSGIGLTICRNILKLHSAKIEAESKIGEGSIFTIYFNKVH